MPSYLRYGASVHRGGAGRTGTEAIEHRFVGLFTIAAINANVL